MLETLKSFDQGLFLFLNGRHSPFFDAIMFWGTNSLIWLPLYGLLLYLVIRRYKWQAIWVVLFAVLMIIVSDQLSNFFKDFIERARPTYEPGLRGVHTVNRYLGGQFGFYSAHASTNLAIALYFIILLERPFRFFPMVMLI